MSPLHTRMQLLLAVSTLHGSLPERAPGMSQVSQKLARRLLRELPHQTGHPDCGLGSGTASTGRSSRSSTNETATGLMNVFQAACRELRDSEQYLFTATVQAAMVQWCRIGMRPVHWFFFIPSVGHEEARSSEGLQRSSTIGSRALAEATVRALRNLLHEHERHIGQSEGVLVSDASLLGYLEELHELSLAMIFFEGGFHDMTTLRAMHAGVGGQHYQTLATQAMARWMMKLLSWDFPIGLEVVLGAIGSSTHLDGDVTGEDREDDGIQQNENDARMKRDRLVLLSKFRSARSASFGPALEVEYGIGWRWHGEYHPLCSRPTRGHMVELWQELALDLPQNHCEHRSGLSTDQQDALGATVEEMTLADRNEFPLGLCPGTSRCSA